MVLDMGGWSASCIFTVKIPHEDCVMISGTWDTKHRVQQHLQEGKQASESHSIQGGPAGQLSWWGKMGRQTASRPWPGMALSVLMGWFLGLIVH